MSDQLTFLSEEPPANPSALRALEQDWLTRVATWPSSFLLFLHKNAPAGWCGRMSPAYYRAGQMTRQKGMENPGSDGKETILTPSPADLGNSGTVWRGECLTLNISEYPSDAVASSLSDILETGDLPQRYFLSATACRGILRRAEKRGKALPPQLAHALKAVADFDLDGGLIPETAGCLQERDSKGADSDTKPGHLIPVVYENHPADSRITESGPTAPTVTSRYGTGGGNVPLVGNMGAFKPNQSAKARSLGYDESLAPTLESAEGGNNKPAVHIGMQVRRLTPREAERLQGFPDDYTLIKYKGKPASDGPRYKALGNSMAVPVMSWIGRRIQMVEDLKK